VYVIFFFSCQKLQLKINLSISKIFQFKYACKRNISLIFHFKNCIWHLFFVGFIYYLFTLVETSNGEGECLKHPIFLRFLGYYQLYLWILGYILLSTHPLRNYFLYFIFYWLLYIVGIPKWKNFIEKNARVCKWLVKLYSDKD
jgi:hypothetical protein